jgi:hypothetical protein
LYGISQNPDTNDYILVQNNPINLINWMSGNEKIDGSIQEMQSKIVNHHDIVFEWTQFSQFDDIKETGKSDLMTVYLAIWKDGPLYYNKKHSSKYVRDLTNKEVALKCLHNSQNPVEFLINEVNHLCICFNVSLFI